MNCYGKYQQNFSLRWENFPRLVGHQLVSQIIDRKLVVSRRLFYFACQINSFRFLSF